MKGSKLRAVIAAFALLTWVIAMNASEATPASAAACPCNVLGSGTPSNPDNGPDPSPVKLGMRFSADVDGYVTGVRFYKSAANTGVHTGELWEDNTTQAFPITSVTFSGESASGWQTMSFPLPIKIFAGQKYFIAYTTSAGHYARDTGAFANPITSGLLHADTGGYEYNLSDEPGNIVPVNYWVDVTFTPSINSTSLFSMTTAAPTTPQANDGANVEVGTRFYSDVNTKVIGIRYWYNQPWYVDTEVHLWKSDGTLLATADYGDRDIRTGWYEVYFNAPVDITAGSEYVVSYLSGANGYGYSTNFFNSTYSNGYYHAPANAGVYTYNPTSAFPTTQSTTNYWIDPIFDSSAGINNNVAAVVDPSMQFSVAGRASACNGQSSTNFQTGSTATAVSLGHLSSATVGGAAQDLTVNTNAANGFTVYLRTSGTTPHSLRDGNAHSIADVAGTHASPGAAPVAGTAGFGYTGDDVFASNTWANLTNTNDSVIVGSVGTMSKTNCVGYEVAVAATTPAGNYTSTVIYTAVPAF